MTWFRKYRPKKIQDLHLANVRQVVLALMEKGNFPQVLLFAGPKGTGKTSTSRIIGAMLNDPQNADVVDQIFFKKSNKNNKPLLEPDSEADFAKGIFDGQSFVVQEMDAASNRGIDDVRSLRERVMMPPQVGKMSVFILDEAHMLTTEAFNALLKILEEPPPHVVFILATTELHKLPATIISRCTKIDFRKANETEIMGAMQNITQAEKLQVEPSVLQLIAARADGSFRDAVKMLELLADSNALQVDKAQNLLGTDLEQDLQKLFQAVLAKNELKVCNFFEDLRQRDLDEKFFYKSVFEYLHKHLLASVGVEAESKLLQPFAPQAVLRFLSSELLQIDLQQASPIDFLPLELKLLEIIERSKNKSQSQNGSGSASSSGTKTSSAISKISPLKKNLEQDKKVSQSPEKIAQKNDEVDLDQIDASIYAADSIQPGPAVEFTAVEVTDVTEAAQQSAALATTVDSPPITADEGRTQLLLDRWDDFVRTVGQENPSLAALLRSSTPLVSTDGMAKVGVYYRFHQEQLQMPKFSSVIAACSEKVVGTPVKFNFLLQEIPKEVELKEAQDKNSKLSTLVEEVLM